MWSGASSTWLAALTAPHNLYTRAELWYGGAFVSTVDLIGGQVQVTARNRIRRTFTGDLPETLWPTSSSSTLNPYGAVLKVFRGIAGVNDALIGQAAPIFTGRIETIGPRDRKGGKFQVTALDPFADVNDAQFEQPKTPVAGTGTAGNIMSLIAEVRTDADFLDQTGLQSTLPNLLQGWDTDRGAAIDELAQAMGAEVFFLPDGMTCVIRLIPTLAGTPVWTLQDGVNGTMIRDTQSKSRTDVANRVIVHVEQPGQTPFTVTCTDSLATSLTRYGGPYGTVVRHLSNRLITDAGQATTAGNALLARFIGLTRTREIECVCNPALEAGDLIQVTTSEGTELHIADEFTVGVGASDSMVIKTRSTQRFTS